MKQLIPGVVFITLLSSCAFYDGIQEHPTVTRQKNGQSTVVHVPTPPPSPEARRVKGYRAATMMSLITY